MKIRQTLAKKTIRHGVDLPSPSRAIAEIKTVPAFSNDRNTYTRKELIVADAYYRAEKRGFVPGCELDDWLAAERAVDSRL